MRLKTYSAKIKIIILYNIIKAPLSRRLTYLERDKNRNCGKLNENVRTENSMPNFLNDARNSTQHFFTMKIPQPPLKFHQPSPPGVRAP